MRSVLLSPRWLLGHLLALAAAATCVRLGWWQWQRAHSSAGSLQNLGYAVQWPAFALFVLLFWWRVVRDELRPPAADRPAPRPAAPPPPPQLVADDPEDAELIAYNRYLARLHEQDRRQAQ